MAVNLSAIKDLLLPGLRGIEGKYEMIPAQYDKIFTKHDSKLALERTAELRFLGLAQLKTEGGQTAFDNGAGERYVYNQEHTEIGLGYAITRKAIDDNLYKTQFHPSNLGLIESFHQMQTGLFACLKKIFAKLPGRHPYKNTNLMEALALQKSWRYCSAQIRHSKID